MQSSVTGIVRHMAFTLQVSMQRVVHLSMHQSVWYGMLEPKKDDSGVFSFKLLEHIFLYDSTSNENDLHGSFLFSSLYLFTGGV